MSGLQVELVDFVPEGVGILGRQMVVVTANWGPKILVKTGRGSLGAYRLGEDQKFATSGCDGFCEQAKVLFGIIKVFT